MSSRTDINYLKNILIEKGYTPLFTSYKHSREKLEVLCFKHGKFLTTGYGIKRGDGCYKCGRETYAKKRRFTIEKVRERCTELGLNLINKEFPSVIGRQILTFECPIHGLFDKDCAQVMRGKGCSICGHIRGGNKNKKTTEQFIKDLSSPDYKIVSEYISSSTKLKVECPIHGIFLSRPDDLLGGHGCPKCGNRSMKTQNDIASLVKEKGFDIEENNRIIIRPLELDIYIPSKNVAIEYCGIFWHTEDKKGVNSHFKKYIACKEKGIQLITIFSDEWLEKESQVRNILNAKLGILPKIFARKCEVRSIDKEMSDTFLDKYHLQGSVRATVRLGLFYDGCLVGIITGGPHHRQGQGNIFVLNRLCFGTYSVVGGSSKLFKVFKEKVKEAGFSKIVSWSDNRWSNGSVYKKIGFILDEELKIDYSYCKGKKRISKQACQKRMLFKKGATGNTEKEMALSLELRRIWDCGKKRWILDL